MGNLVSIILPVYNAEKYLDQCVKSILNQSYKNFELLMINDGSKDKSLDICKKWEKLDKRVRVFDKKNGGCASARNEGLENALGEYIVFVDADDFIIKNHIELLVSTMKKADLGIINFKRIRKRKNDFNQTKFLNKKIVGDYVAKDDFYKALFSYPKMGGGLAWNKIYKKKLIQNLRFNPQYKYHEDINFVLQYSLRCNLFYYIKNISYLYLVNDESMTSQKIFSESRFSGLQVMKDNNEIAKKISKKVLSYSKAWQFLVNIEILFAFKHFKLKNKEVKDDVLKTLKETYPDFKRNKNNFNWFRRLGGVAYKLMKLFRY